MRYLLLGLLGAAVFLYARLIGLSELGLFSKGIPVIALLLWLRNAPNGLYRRWLTIGLLCSLAGDILLDWPADLFVFGLGAFLLAHLAYLRAYLSDCKQPAWLALLLALTIGGTMFATLASANLGSLLIPCGLLCPGHQRDALARPRPPRPAGPEHHLDTPSRHWRCAVCAVR